VPAGLRSHVQEADVTLLETESGMCSRTAFKAGGRYRNVVIVGIIH
jgi:hypothetical protein